jgi:hypothetical protein
MMLQSWKFPCYVQSLFWVEIVAGEKGTDDSEASDLSIIEGDSQFASDA